MKVIRQEYFYTAPGPQRPVFFGHDTERVRFSLELGEGDEGRVQVTYDPVPKTGARAKAVVWEEYEGGSAGALYGVTGIRTVIGAVKDWVVLVIEQEKNHGK